MDANHMRWDKRSAEQWLEEAGRFEKMADRFDENSRLNTSFAALARDARRRAAETSSRSRQVSDNRDWRWMCGGSVTPVSPSDADYYRGRAASERKAADDAQDSRVRRVHLEMAGRYQALVPPDTGGEGLAS